MILFRRDRFFDGLEDVLKDFLKRSRRTAAHLDKFDYDLLGGLEDYFVFRGEAGKPFFTGDIFYQFRSCHLIFLVGGAGGTRTLDLVNAIHALSQLSYGPTPFGLRKS